MFVLVALCLIAGILPGYFIDTLVPVVQMLVGAHLPQQTGLKWLTIVPIAESRSSYNGLLLFLLIAGAAWLAAFVIHRWGSHAIRRSAIWGCGFAEASTATQYTAGSFAQPIRRVFGTLVFRAREEIDMPAPGDSQPARMHVHLRDLLWDTLYLPVAKTVAFTADTLNRVQFLTIRGYLTLVSGALVALLVVLAIWQ
jgi:hydrogenase-4 component B